MRNEADASKRIVRTIEGIAALCLGSADRVVWVDQADSAAFSDGERLFLPAPSGEHEHEYELLLALALREVSKIQKADASAFAIADPNVVPFAAAIEEVRLKAELAKDFRGAPGIFNRAVHIASSVFAKAADAGELTPSDLNALAAWSAAHAALLGTDEARAARATFEQMAMQHADPEKLRKALVIAESAPNAASTAEAVLIGSQIWQLFHQELPPEGEPEEGAGSQDEQQQGETQGQQQEGAAESNSANSQSDEEAGASTAEPHGAETEAGAANELGGKESEQRGPPTGDAGNQEQEGAASSPQGGPQCSEPGSNAGDSSSGGESIRGDTTSSSGTEVPGDGNAGDAQDRDADLGTASAAGSHCERQAMPDPLSDALARLKGHAGAKDRSADASEFIAHKAEKTGAVDEQSSREELRSALQSADVQPTELQAIACSDGKTGTDDEPLAALLMGGDGYADAANNAGRSLLTSIPAKLVTVLLRELQDLKRRPFQRAFAGPRVNAAQAWRLSKLGDARIFRKKAPASGIDAAIGLMLDRSQSMEDNGFEQAVEIVHAFLVALKRMQGVQTSLDVFPGSHATSEELLGFKQNIGRALAALRVIVPSGGTPTGSAIAARLRKLIACRCEKKQLILVTDGQPDPQELSLTIAVIEQATALGIDVIGIGIGIDVSALFPISVSVRNVNELPDALARLFRDELAHRLAV